MVERFMLKACMLLTVARVWDWTENTRPRGEVSQIFFAQFKERCIADLQFDWFVFISPTK